MLKRLSVYTLLAALINGAIGCSRMATIRTEETGRPRCEVAISRVELRPIIASVETSDQNRIQFDTCGGRFLPESGVFVGRKLEGDSIRVGLASVTGVQEYRRFPDLKQSSVLDLSIFTRELTDFRVHGVHVDTVAPRGPRIVLADSSGWFTPDGKRFTGRTWQGHYFDVPADDITASWTKEKRFSYVKTGLLVTSSLIFTAAIVFIIVYNHQDPYFR